MRKWIDGVDSNILNIICLSSFTFFVVVIRTLQLGFLTDYDIGSYMYEKNFNILGFSLDSSFLTFCLYFLVILYFSIDIFLNLKNKQEEVINFSDIKNSCNIFLKVCQIFCFVFVVCLSILYISDINHLKLNNYKAAVIIFVFQIITSFCFIYFFYLLKTSQTGENSILGILFLLPVVWSILRLFSMLGFEYFAMLTPRETVLNGLKVATVGMFFFYFGRFVVGMHSLKNQKNLKFFGLLSIFLTFGNVLPKIFVYFMNKIYSNGIDYFRYAVNVDIFKGYNFILIDFILGIFISVFIFTYIFNKSSVKKL